MIQNDTKNNKMTQNEKIWEHRITKCFNGVEKKRTTKKHFYISSAMLNQEPKEALEKYLKYIIKENLILEGCLGVGIGLNVQLSMMNTQ